MSQEQKYCTEPFGVEVEGKMVYIRFKLPRFILPGAGMVNSQQLIEKEQRLQEELLALKQSGADENTLRSAASRMALPKLLAPYVESCTGSQVFDYEVDPAGTQSKKGRKKKSIESEETE